MKIGNRNLRKIFSAIFDFRHYQAFFNIFLVCDKPIDFFRRYFLAQGDYPVIIKLKTPLGFLETKIYSYFDALTVNEIFCRLDYECSKNIEVAVDFGSNIGISAMYFLSRNKKCKTYLFEPDPQNIKKLKKNLSKFENRYFLEEKAVAIESGIKNFGIDPAGRCGGLKRKSEEYIKVKCLGVNKVLGDILAKEEKIDLLKIDIEGSELEVLKAVNIDILKKIKIIYFEIDHAVEIDKNFSFYPEIFKLKKRGETFKLIKK